MDSPTALTDFHWQYRVDRIAGRLLLVFSATGKMHTFLSTTVTERRSNVSTIRNVEALQHRYYKSRRPLRTVEELVRRLSAMPAVEATRKLTDYYVRARFRLTRERFEECYVDGSNDGGIDFWHREDNTFFIFQTKFSGGAIQTSSSEISNELRKILNSITGQNPNLRAERFMNDLRSALGDPRSTLELVWLTTKLVPENASREAQAEMARVRAKNGWKIDVDFAPVDRNSLRSVSYDIEHGHIPYTGKRILRLENEQWIENSDESTQIYSVVGSVKLVDMLRWFSGSEVSRFLQKNVRGFQGDNDVNLGIVKSFTQQPSWFWYKHNGIIIFADNVTLDRDRSELILRNPQVVNGGQTVTVLFRAFDKLGRPDNQAKVLVRVYRLPYESSEAYEKGIALIAALNSQTKILPSDLRSNDPRQVRIQELLGKLDYVYHRKRARENKASRNSVTMRALALLFLTVKKQAPNIGATGDVEEIFKESSRYDDVFNEREINRDLSLDHIVLKYATTWSIDQLMKRIELPARDEEYRAYARFYVLTDLYGQLEEWRTKRFQQGWQEWRDFLASDHFEDAVRKYSRPAFRIAREIIPARQEARKYFLSAEAWQRYFQRRKLRLFANVISTAYTRFQHALAA